MDRLTRLMDAEERTRATVSTLRDWPKPRSVPTAIGTPDASSRLAGLASEQRARQAPAHYLESDASPCASGPPMVR